MVIKRRTKSDILAFHKEMINKHNLSDFFKKNPDVDKYFLNRVHRPLVKAIYELRKNPSWLSIRRAAKIYFKLEKYIAEATVPINKNGTRAPHLDAYISRMRARKKTYYNNLTYGAMTGAATAMVGKYAASGPNPVNVGVSVVMGSLAGLDLFNALRARTQNPIGYKLLTKIKSQEDLEKITELVYEHYALLRKELETAIKRREEMLKKRDNHK